MIRTPPVRRRDVNGAPVRPERDFVVYWMTAARRTRWSFGLQRAIEWGLELDKPVVVLEALRCGYPWASDRLHRFVLDGMADNAARLTSGPIGYYAYVEPRPGAGRGLLSALGSRACVVVTDEFPAFFLPQMVATAGAKLDTRLEQVDGNGLLPLSAAPEAFKTAYAFRRFLQKTLPGHLAQLPRADPLDGLRLRRADELPSEIVRSWPNSAPVLAGGGGPQPADLPIDHSVSAVDVRGGSVAARRALGRFLSDLLPRYDVDRNHPDAQATSGLSPYLHFGHLSSHEAFAELAAAEGWSADRLGDRADGKRAGWWGMSESAEAWLDQLVTWRELGLNMCAQRSDYDRYDSLPDWAQKTLGEHATDRRPHEYGLDALEAAQTHDRVWNAAQMELRATGRLHNYLRMLWGKKILEWSPSPQEALVVMTELNNKWALDGRDPNSTSGIFWCLGRYDRPWGPERPIFGKVRYMSSENTVRKLRLSAYLDRFAP